MLFKACIFDLDGVIVDTTEYHFRAWKKLAGEIGIGFTREDNERLKGVSRMASLEIILEIGGKELDNKSKEELAAKKNRWYLDFISKMTPENILPCADRLIRELKQKGIKVAVGSASRNTPLILEKIGLKHIFDAVADGNIISNAKPDPEVFLKASEMLGVEPGECIVLEDAGAGIRAARNASMRCVGIGSPKILNEADLVVPDLCCLSIDMLENL